jgi:hypothetical protein
VRATTLTQTGPASQPRSNSARGTRRAIPTGRSLNRNGPNAGASQDFDQQIAIHAAKYRYLFWRPVTAITPGAIDQDTTWTPLIATPRHPEYPSGHAGFGGTAEIVLAALAPSQKRTTFSATSSTDGGATHTWTGWRAITDETIDARVWEGVHFRFSDDIGAQLGREVADYDLQHLDAIDL